MECACIVLLRCATARLEYQSNGERESDATAMMTPMVCTNTIFCDRQMLKCYTCALNRIVRQYCTVFLGVPYT